MSYEQALRAIGQSLEDLHPQSVELEVKGSDFIVLAEVPTEGLHIENEHGLRRFWRKLGSPKAASRGLSLKEIPFTAQDIKRLENRAQCKRAAGSTPRPVPGSLSEILRAIGHYLHSKGAILLRLKKRDREIVVEYETRRGEHKTEEYDVASFYDYSLKSYLQRNMVNYL